MQVDKNYRIVKMDEIVLGERHRVEYKGIEELSQSIDEYGLLQPLIIDDNMLLIAGGRRYRAIQLLKHTHVTVQFRKDVDELTYRELELEENVRREDLTWAEKAKLVSEIDRLKRQKYGVAVANQHVVFDGWRQEDTAIAMRMSQPTVSTDILAARIIDAYPELANEPDRKTAIRKFRSYHDQLERELSLRKLAVTKQEGLDVFHLGKALDVLKTLPSSYVDLILIDPPYGSDMDSINMGKSGYDVHFADDPKVLEMVHDALREARRVLKPTCHVYCFSGIKDGLLQKMMDILGKTGFLYDSIPLVWAKSTYGLVDFEQRFAPAWEPIIFCNGGRPLATFQRNVLMEESVPNIERVNIAQKPVKLLKRLIELSTSEGEVVLDMFAGSGSTLVAAKEANRRYIGVEEDRAQWTSGMLRLNSIDQPAYEEEEDENDVDIGVESNPTSE